MKALAVILIALTAYVSSASAAPRVHVIELDDTIQPASLRYVERGLREAAAADAALVVIELDTPGGLLESLRAMTSAILASPVPVVVYVTPSGARAASAGFFLLMAADVAAMAPGTNTGAAHPVSIGGTQAPRDDRDGEGGEDTSIEKAAKDAAALARSLAERRGRSVTAAEQAVLQSESFSADEAHARGLVEVIAVDRGHLLQALDGRAVTRLDGSTQTLQLDGAEIVEAKRTLAERLLTLIASPQVAYLLLMVGAIGIFIELTNPGTFVPGIVGGIAVLLGMYGLSVLPVSVTGALLIAVGFALLVAEVFATSYGLLAAAGIGSFVIGSLMLVDAPVPALRIGPSLVIPVAVVLAAITALLAMRAVRSRHLRQRSGVEAMIGEAGEVVDAITLEHEGKVFVHGELWAAGARQALPEGAKVRVDAVDGLRLRVSALRAFQPEGISS